MLFDAPAGYVPTEADRDLAARWVPSADQLVAAAAVLRANPSTEYVYAPIALPGKVHGIWTVGQPVEYLDGAPVFLDRDKASHAAVRHLGERPGQPSYAVVWRDGHAAVFEDYRGLFVDDPIRN